MAALSFANTSFPATVGYPASKEGAVVYSEVYYEALEARIRPQSALYLLRRRYGVIHRPGSVALNEIAQL